MLYYYAVCHEAGMLGLLMMATWEGLAGILGNESDSGWFGWVGKQPYWLFIFLEWQRRFGEGKPELRSAHQQ